MLCSIKSCFSIILLVAVLPACAAPATVSEPPPSAGATTVQIYFSREIDALQAVERHIPVTDDLETKAEATLRALLAGPIADEQAAGLSSWFSADTAGMLNDVTIDGDAAVVDLKDLSAIIPNASTAAGSRVLLDQLTTTIFQFDQIQAVQYRFDGSCEAFAFFLQSTCETLTRQEWHARSAFR